jgi:hypothetical protein
VIGDIVGPTESHSVELLQSVTTVDGVDHQFVAAAVNAVQSTAGIGALTAVANDGESVEVRRIDHQSFHSKKPACILSVFRESCYVTTFLTTFIKSAKLG